MTTVLEKLKEARAVLADENRWTKYTPARNSAGMTVPPYSHEATCFCATGAVSHVIFEAQPAKYIRMTHEVALKQDLNNRAVLALNNVLYYQFEEIGIIARCHDTESFNDFPLVQHKHVLKLFDLAIENENKSPT